MNKQVKKCGRCEISYEGDLSVYFYRERRRKDGFSWECKACKKLSENKISRRRRDSERYYRDKAKPLARNLARMHYAGTSMKCSVVTCDLPGEELHHVDYSKPLDVVPLCKNHHRLNHLV